MSVVYFLVVDFGEVVVLVVTGGKQSQLLVNKVSSALGQELNGDRPRGGDCPSETPWLILYL